MKGFFFEYPIGPNPRRVGRSWSSYWEKQLSRNADEVWSGGYSSIATNSGLGGYVYLNRNNLSLCRINGTITKVIIRPNQITDPWHFRVYRKSGATYDRIYEENITSKLTAGQTCTVTLGAGCVVMDGDFVQITTSGDIGYIAGAATSLKYGARATYEPPDAADENFDAYGSLSYILTIQLLAQAPLVVVIGDSIAAGHNGHYSGLEASFTNVPANSIGGQLYLINSKYVYQNMGIGSQTSTNIKDRFTANCVALKPKIAIINGGVNDIAGGSITKATFLANYTTMLDACLTNDILPVVCKILPWTAGTNEQMQTRDEWMADLKTLVESATYNGAVWVDFDTAMGKNRATGDAGNLWDLQTDPDYNDDNIHPTLLGYAKMAEVIDAAITAKGYELV